jgi:antibiotic biosynthesis monooxygenase (ABM) superfamily enzyme
MKGIPTLPVTVAVSLRAKPSHETILHDRLTALCTSAAAFPGHLASDMRTAGGPGAREVIVKLSFQCAADLLAWEHSEQRAGHLRDCELSMEGPRRPLTLDDLDSGLIGDPPGQLATAPARWRTALWVWIALFPTSVAMNFLLVPHLGALPVVLRPFVTTILNSANRHLAGRSSCALRPGPGLSKSLTGHALARFAGRRL